MKNFPPLNFNYGHIANTYFIPSTPTRQKTVLSASAVWTELATSQDCRRLKISKQFCPVSKCGVNWVLSFPIHTQCGYQLWRHIWKRVKTRPQMHSHRRRDWTTLFSLQYIVNVCDCRELSSYRRQDKTRQSCYNNTAYMTVLSCLVGGVN